MKVFSNKREKMCVFFKSRGVVVALFLLYLISLLSRLEIIGPEKARI